MSPSPARARPRASTQTDSVPVDAAYHHTAVDGKPTQGIVRGPRVNKEHLVQYWIRLPLAAGNGSKGAGNKGIGMVLCLDYFISGLEEEERQANSA